MFLRTNGQFVVCKLYRDCFAHSVLPLVVLLSGQLLNNECENRETDEVIVAASVFVKAM